MTSNITKRIMNNQEIVEQINKLRKQQYVLREKEEALDCQIIKLRDSLIPIPKNGYYTNSKGLFCKVYNSSNKEICILAVNVEYKYISEEIESPLDFNSIYKKECSKEEYNKALDTVISHFKY